MKTNTTGPFSCKPERALLPAAGLIALLLCACARINYNRGVKKLYGEVAADSLQQLWFKNSIIYNLDIEVFQDSDGDGTGDLKGLTNRLGYLDSLGVDVIWLSPFQPTPNKDDGYDVADYYGIDPRLGSWQDFAGFMDAAKQHHIRVIMDLVLNHTSDEHPWFIKAKDPASPYHSWYTWSDKRPPNSHKGMVFPGVQKEIWSYDSTARSYYYHRFYNFQPDLNTQNPAVQAEIRGIIKFWIDKGMAGFRIDGVPFFIEVPQKKGDKFERQYEMLTALRQYVHSLKPDAVLLGEINVPPQEDPDYFGESGGRMNMIFNFFVNQRIFYSLAANHAFTLKDALVNTSNIPRNTGWGQFLRNHDEVDLGRLRNVQRRRVYKAFGPSRNMQLYKRGIRRRLAPMLSEQKKIEFAYSLLFALPSTPVIRYGEELGMGDDLSLKERLSVRTPMQWSNAKNAGFSTADHAVRPVIDTGRYNYHIVNVTAEKNDESSLLNFIGHLIALRKSLPELGYGNCELLECDDRVLLLRYTWKGKKIIIAHNFSGEPLSITVNEKMLNNLNDPKERLFSAKGLCRIELDGWGYKWYGADSTDSESLRIYESGGEKRSE